MPRNSDIYICQSCGAEYGKWAGRCDACGNWNTIELETQSPAPPGTHSAKAGRNSGRKIELTSLEGSIDREPRLASNLDEFDRAAGGGLVPGSALLIGGDPGVGKSTLLLQLAAGLAADGQNVIYISGEEAIAQIRLRAARLKVEKAPVQLAAATALKDILSTLKTERPAVAIIDSIQTLWSDTIPAAPGTVTQVRICAQELVRFAKASDCVILLVGHVTKDGQLAGPRVVEHMVDTVMYFEAESGRSFRILRSVKNRFGAAHEIGVFDMISTGLREVANPSELFLAEHDTSVSGAAVFAGIEGTRPVLGEIQALVSQSSLGAPRRAVVGWDGARLSMLLAVLDARCGLDFSRHDVFLNIAGGLRVTEPAADLAAAAALTSALLDIPLPPHCVVFGEVGLSAAIRPVPQGEIRLKEAEKLGFSLALTPQGLNSSKVQLHNIETMHQMITWLKR